MRIGIIADIHSNLPALEAVLEAMPTDIHALVCAGDVIGYSAYPAECVELVKDECDVVVQGNHDRDVCSPDLYDNRLARVGLEYSHSQLSSEQISWLADLPPKTHAFDDRLLLVHSHPEAVDRYVSKRMFSSVATYMSDETQVLALGHTHKQAAVNMSKFSRHGWVVNPGSVGQPRDGNPNAAYAILDLDAPSVELHRTSYPIDKIQTANKEAGLPRKTSDRLAVGK